MVVDDFLKDLLEMIFTYVKIDLKFKDIVGILSVNKAEVLRKYLVEYKTAERCLYDARNLRSVRKSLLAHNVDRLMESDLLIFVCEQRLVHCREISAENVDHLTDDPSVTLGIDVYPDERVALYCRLLDGIKALAGLDRLGLGCLVSVKCSLGCLYELRADLLLLLCGFL